MVQYKVCMVGAFAVGKTSLVRRFVEGVFSEKYLTTVGVKIDKKVIEVDSESIHILLWDLSGKDTISDFPMNYLRGASGLFFVVDRTRPQTLEIALELEKKITNEFGDIPSVFLWNKSDLEEEIYLEEADVERLKSLEKKVLLTSAKTGRGVDEAFLLLTQAIATQSIS